MSIELVTIAIEAIIALIIKGLSDGTGDPSIMSELPLS